MANKTIVTSVLILSILNYPKQIHKSILNLRFFFFITWKKNMIGYDRS